MDYSKLGPALREARKARKETQIHLAEKLSCSQSQISELEQGIRNAVSEELLRRIAQHLDVDLKRFETSDSPYGPGGSTAWACCINQTCPAARAFETPNGIQMKPHFIQVETGAQNCEFCGDLLALFCPRNHCDHPIHPGFFCRGCAQPFIEVPKSIPDAAAAEKQAKRVDEFLRKFGG